MSNKSNNIVTLGYLKEFTKGVLKLNKNVTTTSDDIIGYVYVFLKDDNGTLVFNDTNTLASHTYTGWRVAVGNKAPYDTDGIIEITTANA